VWVIAAMVAQGCVGADLPGSEQVEEPPVRMDGQRPPDPSTNPNVPLPTVDMGSDMGSMDMPSSPEMGAMDMGSMDMPSAMCPQPAICAFGERECEGDQIRTCTLGPDQCPAWGPAVDCSNDFVCRDGACQVRPPVNTCIDDDQDGYGEGCALGPDCDDNDPTVYPGAPELCDGKDNDCNGLIDDGVQGVGDPCTVGVGICEASGSQVCAPSGRLECDAVAGQPQTEVCDGQDNNCNGQVDEGGVCGGATGVCQGDTFQEPNDTLATAWQLAISTPVYGLTCSGDRDYYQLTGLTAGQSTRIALAFPHANADLDLRLFENGTRIQSSQGGSSSDHEIITFTPQANRTYVVEVFNFNNRNNYYRLEYFPASQVACSSEDAMENNDTATRAMLLVANWRTRGYSCANNIDWFDLGNFAVGDRLRGRIEGPLFFPNDLDLELYWRDTTVNPPVMRKKQESTSLSADEVVTHTVTVGEAGRYYLRVFNFGSSERYDISWERLN
jgi:hypothetical protein